MSKRGTEVGDKHFTASIYLISNELTPRALMIFHKKMHIWIQPGGHVELKENPIETIYRETLEETGIDLRAYIDASKMGKYLDGTINLLPPAIFHQQPIPAYGNEPAHYHLDLGYVFKIPPQVPRPAKGESQKVRWFTEEEVKKLDTLDSVKKPILKLLNN